jgi:phosphoglycolate phosphatase-like HAD superfamily hydrolase
VFFIVQSFWFICEIVKEKKYRRNTMAEQQQASAQDAKHSKPDPDVMHAALQKLDMQPGECLMFGDTAYDIESAARAKVPTIAFRCGGWSDNDLRGSLAIYDGPADLLAHYDQSPLAHRA